MMLINYWARLRTVCDAAKLSKVLSLATVSMPASLLHVQETDPPVPLLTFDSVCKLPGRTVRHIPVKDRLAFALALCSALRSALHDNSEDAWLKVFMLPKCLLLAPKHGGRHHKPVPIKSSMRPMVSSVHYGIEHPIIIPLVPNPPLTTNIQQSRQQTLRLREGLLSKSYFDIRALLHSFPKDTACGPSGLHIQHLIEAAEVPFQFPICAVLRDVVNLLISGKVPVQVARFLAGGNLVALEKNKSNCPPDIRPSAVGEAIRRLAGKCLCVITKEKAHDFLAPLQLGVACPAGAEKIIHEIGVQQGDPLGPLLFCLVLQQTVDHQLAFTSTSPSVSSSELSTFPGDLVLCAKFVARKQSEASTEGDMSYESTEGDMSYESTEGGMSYESTEDGMSYESTEGDMSYESTEGGMSYESTEGGMSYESTEGGMSYESTEGGMSYESTEGDMS
eukprot:Em0005g392a